MFIIIREYLQKDILSAITSLKGELMAKFDELKDSVEKLIAAWKAEKEEVKKLIEDAVAKDDAGEEVEYTDLKTKVDEVLDKPMPEPTPSNL